MRWSLAIGLLLVMLPVYAQLYKWTDEKGVVHYSDRPQDGASVKALQLESSAPAAADNWRERERLSSLNRARQAQAEGRLAMQEEAARQKQKPYNPSADRSDKPLSDEDLCTRDRQQIEFAEKTKNLAIGHGVGQANSLTEAQRQEVIRERKANHALTCAAGRRR